MKRELVEAIGTAFVVTATVFAAVLPALAPAPSATTALGSALASGCALAAVTAAFGRGQLAFHPVFAAALWAAGKAPWRRTSRALLAQLLGACVAVALLVFVLKSRREGYDVQALGLGASGYGERSPGRFDWIGVLVAEALFGSVLGLLAVAVQPKEGPAARGPWVLGLAYAASNLALWPVAGGAIHPAQSVATAVFTGGRALPDLWLFVSIPIGAALVAGFAWRWLSREE